MNIIQVNPSYKVVFVFRSLKSEATNIDEDMLDKKIGMSNLFLLALKSSAFSERSISFIEQDKAGCCDYIMSRNFPGGVKAETYN
ncbi:hypothetical protein [Methanosarcina horonobensis]|uniref:hypothetical protein n=1 Tax=Methanosarcina horonobensis TaxID=418008 RepID=UPI000A4D5466|nr:hypothetical protein [Methanosarcina horonobensis]